MMFSPQSRLSAANPGRPRHGLLFLFALALLAPAFPAIADAPAGTRVALTAQAAETLPNDEVVVRFRIEAQGPKAAVLRDRVNRISRAVDVRLKREKGVVQATLGRSVAPVWHYDSVTHKQVQDGWRLVQSAQATSGVLDAVPDWVDAIEKAGAHLDSLTFRVSAGAMEKAREHLRLRAIAEFRARAGMIARALSASSFQILELHTDTALPRQPRPLALAQAAQATPRPVLEAGESRVTVSVSGEILLPERNYPVK